MSTDVVLPTLGESVVEATISRWLKSIGDDVVLDEPLLEVSTDKVDTEIPSPATGVLLKIYFNEDDTAQIGDVLATISGVAATEPFSATPMFATPPPAEPSTPSRAAEPSPSWNWTAPPSDTVPTRAETPPPSDEPEADAGYATPMVRKLAAELKLDLTTIHGSGVGGRVRRRDLLDAAAARDAAVVAATRAAAENAPDIRRGTTCPLSPERVAQAEMVAQTARFALSIGVEADLTLLRSRLTDPNQYFGHVLAAVAAAMRSIGDINASVTEDTVTYHNHENIGLVIDTPDGPLTPVIHDAGNMTPAQLNDAAQDLVTLAAAGSLTPSDLVEGTFTVHDDGPSGVAWAIPAINRPQVAALSIGQVTSRPVVIVDELGDNQIATRDMVWLTLSYDRRAVDPSVAAAFINRLRDSLAG